MVVTQMQSHAIIQNSGLCGIISLTGEGIKGRTAPPFLQGNLTPSNRITGVRMSTWHSTAAVLSLPNAVTFNTVPHGVRHNQDYFTCDCCQ